MVKRQVSDSFPEFHVAAAHLLTPKPDGTTADETVSMTIDMGRVETNLVTQDNSDLRVELIMVNAGHNGVGADLLAAAATMVAEDPIYRSPQPGLTLPELASHVDGSITARHGLFVVPFVWDNGVPHVHEVAHDGESSASDFTHPGRFTVPTQLVMLTDEELTIAERDGVEAVQEHIINAGVQLHDLWR